MSRAVPTCVVAVLLITGCCGTGSPEIRGESGDRPSDSPDVETPVEVAPVAHVTPVEEFFTDSAGNRYQAHVLDAPGGDLTSEDLVGLSPAELRVWRNAIYARYGYPFKSADLQEIFEQQGWYERRSPFDSSQLTARDKANIALIKEAEKAAKADVPADFVAFVREFESAVKRGDGDFVMAHVKAPLPQRMRIMMTPSTLGEPSVFTSSREDLEEIREYWLGMDEGPGFDRPRESEIEHYPGWQLVLGPKMYAGAGIGRGKFRFEGRGRQVAASNGVWKPGKEWGDSDNESTLLFARDGDTWVLEEIYLVRFYP